MDTLTQRLKALSSAEDFMQFFGIPFDERVVQVNRLHILKRFYQYLHQANSLPPSSGEGLSGLDEVALFRRYRELLVNAYQDFVNSTPAKEKVFKVFQDADGTQHVQLASLRESLPGRKRETPAARAA
ncbi:MAG: nitrogenase-stabilizing/protective protein NifW [Burkholderiales bacterium]|nr:nitrogenase-stabilizing/protective protein NifW [Burkholderiales bacterium]